MSVIILAIIGLAVVFGIVSYNQLIRLRNQFKNAFSQIDVQLKRRYDLIPNLVETVKAYMKHEREALEAVIRARNSAASAAGRAAANPADARAMQELIGAESALGQSLGRLVALAEAYPDLKANQNMGQLMEELASTENRVSFARQAYNDAVMHYNNAREGFPINLFAAGLGFQPATSYEIANPAEKEPVRVSFSA